MKAALIILILILASCDGQPTKTSTTQTKDSLQIKNNSEKAIATLKDFYFSVYGNDESNDG